MKPSLAIFLHSDAYDRVYQAASLLLTASSMGWPCHLFLFYRALADFMNGAWESTAPEGTAPGSGGGEIPDSVSLLRLERNFAAAGLPSVQAIIEKARGAEGGLKLYACSASVRIMELDPTEVRRRVDEIVGLPTMFHIAESSRFAWYI